MGDSLPLNSTVEARIQGPDYQLKSIIRALDGEKTTINLGQERTSPRRIMLLLDNASCCLQADRLPLPAQR